MKKLALFSVLLCLCGVYTVPAFATCGAHTLGFDGNQDPDDDEFLYENKRQFDLTMQGYNNSNEQNSGEGKGIECDTTNSAGCDSGHVIELLPGHVFKGSVVNAKRKYQCTSSFFGDDMWVVVGGFCETQWGNLNVGQAWKARTTVECSGLNKTENNVDAVILWDVICREGGLVVCKPTKCKEGYKLDAKNGKCICDNCGGNGGGKKTCEQLYPNDAEAIACCKQEGSDKWNKQTRTCKCKDSSKKWNSSKKICEKQGNGGGNGGGKKTCEQLFKGNQAAIDCCNAKDADWVGSLTDGRCECVEKDKEWNSEKKQCVAKETPVPPVVEEGECEYYFTGQIKCANGNQYFERKVIKLPKSKINKECGTDILNADVVQVMELMQNLCKPADNNTVIWQNGPSSYEVDNAQRVLSAFTSSAKENASVWKTSEGKFNTTRLASDITAGVVLGTVGGVVTGVVIKKNQVKKGFEALHCTVGGQKVADWGDEFSVGLQR